MLYASSDRVLCSAIIIQHIKNFFNKKCPVRTSNFPVKSRLIRYMCDLRCREEFENVGTFIVLRRKTGAAAGPTAPAKGLMLAGMEYQD